MMRGQRALEVAAGTAFVVVSTLLGAAGAIFAVYVAYLVAVDYGLLAGLATLVIGVPLAFALLRLAGYLVVLPVILLGSLLVTGFEHLRGRGRHRQS